MNEKLTDDQILDIDKMTDRMNALDDQLDPMPITSAIVLFTDHIGIDPVDTIDKYLADETLTLDERLVIDFIECSQSNFQQSVGMIREALDLDALINDQ